MDVTREDIDRLTAAMQGMTGTLGRVTNSLNADRENARKTLRQQMGDAARNSAERSRRFEGTVMKTEQNLANLTGSIQQTTTHIRRLIGGVFGGAILGVVLERGTAMARTFSDLNEVGQNFGGSMLKMHKAAADAGLPLTDFADLIKKNGEAISKMGTEDFARFALSVRKSTANQGMYGYTIEQLNSQVGEYAKTAAMYGTANTLSTRNSTASMVDLAANTSTLSAVTKKSREEISQLANEAMRGALAIGGMLKMDAANREATHKTLANVTSVFAAQQGEAGRILSKFAADTFGSGFSALTEGGKMLYEKGMGDLASDMDVLAQKIRNGTATQEDAFRYNNKFMDSIDRNAQMLTMLASTGDSTAAQLLEARSHMKQYTAKEIEQAKKDVTQRASITRLFQSFEHRIALILTSLQSGFYKGIEPFLERIGKMVEHTNFDFLQKKGEEFGIWFGRLIERVFNQSNMNQLDHVIDGLISFGKTTISVLGKLTEWAAIVAPVAGTLLNLMLKGATLMGSVTGAIGSVADTIFGTGQRFEKSLAGIGAALTLYFGPKLLKATVGNFLKGFFSSKTLDRKIIANVVNIHTKSINGGGNQGGGDFGGGSEGGGSGGGRRRSWAARRRLAGQRLRRGMRGMHGRIGRGLLGGGLLLGGMFGLASAAEAEGFNSDTDEAKPASVSTPLRVMNANMISDQKERAKYQSLIRERLELRNKKETEETKKRLADIDEQLKPINQKYAATVTDPHDFIYTRLHGKLPPGASDKKINPQPRNIPKPKPSKKEEDDSSSWMDYASMGLGLASFVPGLGIVAGGLGAGLDLMRGDKTGAALSAASMIPFAGDAAAAGKMARMAGKVGSVARFGQMGRDFAPMIMGLGGGAAAMVMGDSSDEEGVETFANKTDTSQETKAINRLISQQDEQSKILNALVLQLAKNQEDNTKMLSKLYNTKP